MSELPMTAEQFFDIFRAYNQAVWPAPIAWTVFALATLYVAIRRYAWSSGVVAAFLAAIWLWSGIAYHILYHAPVNPIAYVFGGLFVVQAAMFAVQGVARKQITFAPRLDVFGFVGGFLLFYALIDYQIIGYFSGHRYPAAPTFGAPCPTTIFTFGVLLWTVGRIRWSMLIIPTAWAFVAVGAALNWGVLEDAMMPVAALVTVIMLIHRNRRLRALVPIDEATEPRALTEIRYP